MTYNRRCDRGSESEKRGTFWPVVGTGDGCLCLEAVGPALQGEAFERRADETEAVAVVLELVA